MQQKLVYLIIGLSILLGIIIICAFILLGKFNTTLVLPNEEKSLLHDYDDGMILGSKVKTNFRSYFAYIKKSTEVFNELTEKKNQAIGFLILHRIYGEVIYDSQNKDVNEAITINDLDEIVTDNDLYKEEIIYHKDGSIKNIIYTLLDSLYNVDYNFNDTYKGFLNENYASEDYKLINTYNEYIDYYKSLNSFISDNNIADRIREGFDKGKFDERFFDYYSLLLIEINIYNETLENSINIADIRTNANILNIYTDRKKNNDTIKNYVQIYFATLLKEDIKGIRKINIKTNVIID